MYMQGRAPVDRNVDVLYASRAPPRSVHFRHAFYQADSVLQTTIRFIVDLQLLVRNPQN